MELRTLISGYGDLVQEIVRTKNRYNALFRQSAIRLKDRTSYTSDKWISQLETRTQQFVARPLLEQIAVLNQHHEQYLKRFEQNLRRFKEMRHIASVPGFGVVRTNQVVGIVVSPHRFVNKYHFYSYAMLVKHAKDSGGRSYGSIRAHGREELKSIFKMATDSVLRSENAYRRSYRQMLLAGAKQHAARNWVTRALTATVLAVWKKGEKYNDHLWDREVTPAVAGRNKRV
jgi:transposase